MIKIFNLFLLRAGELMQFCRDAVNILQATDLAGLEVSEQGTAFINRFESAKSTYSLVKGSLISKELAAIDRRRDTGIRGILDMLDAYALHYDPNVVAAAERIKQQFNRFGVKISRQNYQTETNNIFSLEEQVNGDASLQADFTLIHLTDWFNQLTSENHLFSDRYAARVAETVEQGGGKFMEERPLLIEAFRQFCVHVNAHITLKGDAAYKVLTEPLNVQIEKYQLTVKTRLATPENPEDETVES
ncbi:MAG: DUF6261 family protein [Salinivirgaceae bacterium]